MPWIASAPTQPTALAIRSRTRDLRGASYSDVHLGHPQNPTERILTNLRIAFPDNEETAALDIVFMGGDLFDMGMAYADGHIPLIEEWALSHLRLMAKYGIAFRVLAGTHSHDRGQAKMFMKLVYQHAIPIDIIFVEKVWVEVNVELGISILYVPDFTTIDEETMWERSQKALTEAGVTEVDYANVHGAFSYQMPDIAEIQRTCHRMARYLSIVKQYIFSGHIHLSSIYERIYCNGSFDRLNHGEEAPKGHWRFHAPTSGKDELRFVENEQAMIFRTVVCTAMPLDESLHLVEREAEALEKGAHLRIEAERSHPLFLSLPRLRQNFPFLHWTIKAIAVGKVTDDEDMAPLPQAIRVPLTNETVGEILKDRMMRRGVDVLTIDHAMALLPTYL